MRSFVMTIRPTIAPEIQARDTRWTMGEAVQSGVYQLYVELVDSEPPIWRRLQVPAQISLRDLHRVLQAVMGWQNRATYAFRVGEQRFGNGAGDAATNPGDTSLPLAAAWQIAAEAILYDYDPQDGWLHRLELESHLPEAEPQVLCLTGERACPPEQSGGIWGYEELLEQLNDPDDPAYDDLWDRLGGDFDPDWFDIKAANQRLSTLMQL